MSSLNATLIGFSAILMWSLLALLTVASGAVPPFQLAAMTFAIGGAIGAVWVTWSGSWSALRQGPRAWALGVGGLFGYHALYFISLRLAPPAEAGLVNYLWPLLIVLFSGLLPGERLRWYSVAGALIGFAGTAILFVGKGVGLAPTAGASTGYIAAFMAAFVWAGYSVLSRRLAGVPTAAVAGFCLVTAALAAMCHLVFETTVWPQGLEEWEAVVALGVGPVGAAFYAWDIGVKRGDIRLLGVASYAAPVLSTLFLVLAGFAEARMTLLLSALLIAGGGLLAAQDMLRRK
ncbi:aromatic amino acid exporter YddG [Undibacter mobilis]|uniref:EamA family transporter n=1 Tax=Undibacter mobilis TaxID=2292256 RepID=A0A371B8I6_9BRAD|nr:EamA family transporter [Undibacter mobilis]RDV03837.1 EamA family transporter [Undibacter mobilis]